MVDGPSLPSQQDVDAPMAVSDAGFTQLANTLAETGLLGTTVPVVVGRTIEAKSTTGTPDAGKREPTSTVDVRGCRL